MRKSSSRRFFVKIHCVIYGEACRCAFQVVEAELAYCEAACEQAFYEAVVEAEPHGSNCSCGCRALKNMNCTKEAMSA